MHERHFVPIGLDQQVVVDFCASAPPNLMNLSVRIDIDGELNEEQFMDALKLTVQRLPYSRYRLHKLSDGTMVQYESTMEEQSFEPVIDAAKLTDKALEKKLSGWAMEPFPHNYMDTQLFRARLLRRSETEHCLFFCSHHTVMDIYAIVFFITYLDQVYGALQNGTPLPREGGDPEKVVLKRNAFMESEKCEKELTWWREVFRTEPQFTSLNGLGHPEFVKGKKYGKERSLLQIQAKDIVRTIPKELVQAINEASLSENYSPYMHYYLALAAYLGRVCETEDVCISSLNIHRGSLDQKSSGLSRACAIPMRTRLPESKSFAEALKYLNLCHRDYLKHLEYPEICRTAYGWFGIPDGMRYDSIFLTFMPLLNYGSFHMKVKASKIESGASMGPLYILIIPADDSGELCANYQYANGYIKPENIEKFHDFMLKFLKLGMEHPDLSLGELIDKSI